MAWSTCTVYFPVYATRSCCTANKASKANKANKAKVPIRLLCIAHSTGIRTTLFSISPSQQPRPTRLVVRSQASRRRLRRRLTTRPSTHRRLWRAKRRSLGRSPSLSANFAASSFFFFFFFFFFFVFVSIINAVSF